MPNKIINFDTFMLSTDKHRAFKRETVFTNDENSVEINFNVKDIDDLTPYTPQVLLYMRDGSFYQISEGVTKDGNVVKYTLKGNEGKHGGLARTQLVLIDGESELASAKFEFNIESGLGGVASEVMIKDWSTLLKEARDYIDLFVDNEAARQTTFETNEAARQSLYDDLVETGVLQSNINTKLAELEEEYAPRFADVTAQLARTTTQTTNAYKSAYKSSASVGNDTPSLRIVFKDDDGMSPVLTRLKDLSIAKGVPWTIGLIRDSQVLSSPANIAETLELQDTHGWEIAAHTYAHEELATYTEPQLVNDFEQISQLLRSNGFNVNNLIYPFGSHNDLVQKVASRYFRSASRTGDLVHNRFDRMEMFSLKRVSIPYGSYYSTTLEALKGRVDTALSDNNGENLLIFCTHVWGMNEADWQILSDLLDYINSLNIPCTTMNDALDQFAPVTYTGYWNDPDHFQLLPNGKILSNRAKTKVAPENSHSASDTLLDFELDTVTITAINNAQADGLPNNAAGLLTTNRIASTNAYSYQLFQEYGNDKLYIRKATGSLGVFQPWSEIAVSRYGVSKVTTVNAHDGNTPLSAFPIGLTHNGVNDAQAAATNLPNGKSGMLMTYRSYADSIQAYAYQTYQEYNSQKLHIRTASTSGAWQAWHEITTSREGAHVADVANKHTASTPIADFPKGIITHAVTSGNTTGLPDEAPGLLTTYNVQTNGFFRQEFRKYLSNEVWSRFVDESGAWTTWVKISAI